MQGIEKEGTTWRLEERHGFTFNAEVWSRRPLPVTIWCNHSCNGLTPAIRVHYREADVPTVVSGFCQKCGRKLEVTIKFTWPPAYEGQLLHLPKTPVPRSLRVLKTIAEFLGSIPTISGQRSVISSGIRNRAFTQFEFQDSSSVVVAEGDELIWDRRGLPQRKEVAIKCRCGRHTHPFVILRDYSAYRAEEDALKETSSTGLGFLRLSSLYNRIFLQGYCGCGKLIEANIKLTE